VGLLQAWLSRWLLRSGVAAGVLLLGLHLLLNKALLPLANRALLPGLLADASRLTMREVRVGCLLLVVFGGCGQRGGCQVEQQCTLLCLRACRVYTPCCSLAAVGHYTSTTSTHFGIMCAVAAPPPL
jgi:hypothetical protein